MLIRKVIKYLLWKINLFLIRIDKEAQRERNESIEFQKTMSTNSSEAYEKMYSDKNYLEQYLDNDRLHFYKKVAEKTDSFFKGDKGTSKCLDVGCGTGHLLVELRRKNFSGVMVGLDVVESAEKVVLSHSENLEFVHGYLSEHNWENEFDLIMCTEVLEHCEDPEDIVSDLIRAAKPGGLVVITVPDGRKDTWDGHIHFWSPESFKLFINKFGVKVKFDYFDDVNFCAISC